MPANFRHFRAGPDPAGRSWRADLMWMQTAVAIRHSDSIDVKFLLSDGSARIERVVSLRHPDLLELSRKTGQPVTDPWCCRLAALHLTHMIETGEDFEKTLVTVEPSHLARYGEALAGA
ncbi:MAG: hypothetical protein IT159_07800 [Bryobacterales bacterium]|nr:hypothetical protein [Bryobacterales bacterium]